MEKLTEETLFKRPIKILCLDDEENVLKSLSRLMRRHKIDVDIFTEADMALEAVMAQEYEVIVSDMRMPIMDGATFLAKAKDISPDSQRVLLTGYSDMESTVAAINKGGIHAYVQKPWTNDYFVHLIKEFSEKFRTKKHNFLLQEQVKAQNAELKVLNEDLESLVEKRTAQIRKVLKQLESANEKEKQEHKATVELLYNFINANPYLNADAAKRVAKFSKRIAEMLNLNKHFVEVSRMASCLSQVGLLAMEPSLYNRPVQQLDEKEKKIYFTHPATAQLMLMPAPHLSDVAEAIYHQYEKFNGNGIPKGLKGKEIPICAQILAVSRDYVNHSSNQQTPFGDGQNTALEQIKLYSGSFYHPKVVDCLSKCIHEESKSDSKVGSMNILTAEQLEVGMELGLDLHSNKGILLLPKGHIFNEKTINKIKQLEKNRPIPFRIITSV